MKPSQTFERGRTGTADRHRRVAFASAAAVLLAITVVLALRDPDPASRHQARPQRSDAMTAQTASSTASEPHHRGDPPNTAPPSAPSRSPNSAPPATKLERETKNAPAVAPREARAATAAARAFLDGYLPYSYGRSDAGRIQAAAWRLLRELKASPPRVPATVARARPQLISVRAEAATSDLAVDVLAVIDDGQRRYSIPLAVRHAGRRWIATAVGG